MKKVFLSAIMSVLTIFSLGAVSTLAPKPAHAANNTIICPDGEPVTVPTNVTAETGYGKLCEAHGGGTQGIFSNVNMMNTLNTVLNVIVGLVGFVAVAVMILGGISFATSQGDTAKTARAKNMIIFGLVGLIVALLAFAIVNFVLTNVFKSQTTTPS